MEGSVERVRAVLRGELPDRAPLYDLLRNDAVLSHFGGQPLTLKNAAEVVYRAHGAAVDATRPTVRLPNEEKTTVLEDGRQQRDYRWTTWVEPVKYPDPAAYAAAKRASLQRFNPSWTLEKQRQLDADLRSIAEHRAWLGEMFFFPNCPLTGLMGIYGEVGLEQFCYYLAEYPDIISELLERNVLRSIAWVEHLPEHHGIEAAFSGDDIAFGTGPLLSPAWFREHYFWRLARVIAAYHARGIKVLFHSDGNLNLILDDLVEAGIDGLNPIEVTTGMDVGEIHRRYPHLFMAGGIDVSQLLPYGTPEQVRDTVHRAIEAAEGRLMVGSTTELNNDVPLDNYLALRKAVLDHPYR